ncbi:transcriptional regulator, IclR family [Bosea sp. OK403]|uniref:IclR family transcriptional regulator n=1 Tax=Bosea sp. OK403 TaxID=1855286 RepID=UPI0008DFE736|nr:IclR family transcriptional regulator [Bosea sp. OK403]SFI42106.1 transcriptional regulator, IclR family [Bosea sp. OK403]
MDRPNLAVREASSEPTGAQSIGRAAALLRLVASSRTRGASLSELVDGSRLQKPTCRRILVALIEAGLIEQEAATRRYFLGPESFILGTIAADRFGIHRLAQEGVVRLAQATGDAAFLQVRRDWTVVCLQREDGDYPIRSHVLAPSDRHLLGAGVGGIALLAALDDEGVEQAMAANAAQFPLRYPMLSRAIVDDLVAEARERGYAMNRGLLFPGSWGMAMVVRDAQGRADACLSLAAIESRMQPDREPFLAQLLRDEVARLEARLREFHIQDEARPAQPGASAPLRRRAGERR